MGRAMAGPSPIRRAEIEGHADQRGTNEYNLALGERRAKSTMNYLVSQGVQAGRITIISYGEERPVCTERTEACWGMNRRAHFLSKPR
jgi:peptidoglycan-associated lipoprotein